MMGRLLHLLRRRPWAWGLGVGLGVLLALTAVVREYAVWRVENNVEGRQTEVVEEALTSAEERFNTLRGRVHRHARRIAEASPVREGLHVWHDQETRSDEFVHYVVNRPRDDRTTVEVYADSLYLLAWSGTRMPLGEVADEQDVPQTPRTTVVRDGEERLALVAWVPVRRDGGVLGAVRVVRLIRYQPSIQNRYVRGFRLEEEWEQETGESLQVGWSSSPLEDSRLRVLEGVQGNALGFVTVDPPSPERLVERTAAFYDDFLAAWLTLLIVWCVGLASYWYLRLARREGLRRLPEARAAAAWRFAGVGVLLVGSRYALLALDVPSRWVVPGTGLAPLFDPTHFASPIGGGIFQSIGDLLLTGVWGALLAVGMLHLARRYRLEVDSLSDLGSVFQTSSPPAPSWWRFGGTAVLLVGGNIAGIVLLAYIVRRAVLDSTLDFFSRTGLLPEPLVLGVLCGLFLLVTAGALLGIAGSWIALHLFARHRPVQWSRGVGIAGGLLLSGGLVAALYLGTDVSSMVPLPYLLGALGVGTATSLYGLFRAVEGTEVLTLRGLLVLLFGGTLLLYPLLYTGMDAQRREHMVNAARSFEEGGDPRVLYSIQQMLRTSAQELVPALEGDAPSPDAPLDSIASRILRQSLLTSLTTYETSFTLLDGEGTVLRRYTPREERAQVATIRADRGAFSTLHPRYNVSSGVLVEQISGTRLGGRTEANQFSYVGLHRLTSSDGEEVWALVRAEPRSILPGSGPGVPRVLLPDGSFGDLYAELSLAEFRNGTLVRSFGRSFERTQLQLSDVNFEGVSSLWRYETERERKFLTYYHRFRPETAETPSTVAVRIPAILAFDHLYYLLRLTVAGLCVGLFVYLLGLYVRYRRGCLPARRVQFRDKVLNAFLVVGIVSMVAVGIVGVQVVTGENERIQERRLQEQLTRVEETLALEAGPDERLWEVAARMDVDSLSDQVGFELRLFRDEQLARTSQPRLVRDGLIDERLPGEVHHELYDEAYRFTTAEAAVGQFGYMVGYQALMNDEGRPQIVVGVPTLAQQERVEEEQARTLAYLFGALLLLVVVVILTAVVLANALAQPIAQLREGLEAVGEGRFARELPVETRDEIGDLVRTFNEMRAQLAESRRKLAQQEREVAWREMARQVAHEIKNPLTPMKLSIQHLRRAFKRTDGASDDSSFAELFDRITGTLIDQIESLVRIADEFSTFARMPTRVLEALDINEVIREAVQLMEEEVGEQHSVDLELEEGPLVVEADREELRRIYINLLKNAVQAIPDDRDGRIRVTTRRTEAPESGPGVRSEVIDNGSGIPPDQQDKIFQPNFSTKTSGTGLGLAIAQKGIEELGGEIGFDTEEGEGSTFWICLPLAEETEHVA